MKIVSSTSFILSLLVLLALACTERGIEPDGEPSGSNEPSILPDTVAGILEKSGSPYLIQSNLVVDTLTSLTIEAGVKLIFSEGVKFLVKGNLRAAGTVDQPIEFTTRADRWGGLSIRNKSGNPVFRYVVFEKAQLAFDDPFGYGALAVESNSVIVENCRFLDNKAPNGGALAILGGNFTIRNNIFLRNMANAYGGATLLVEGQGSFFNNSLYLNDSFNYGGGLVLINPMGIDIQNNIFFQNTNSGGDPRISVLITNPTSSYTEGFNFLWQRDDDPLFQSGDELRLLLGSPCIDAGNPADSFLDTDGSRNDQGAYGGLLGNW